MNAKINAAFVSGLVLVLGLAASGTALGHGWDEGGKGLMRGYAPQAGVTYHPAQRQAIRVLHQARRNVRGCPYARANRGPARVPSVGSLSRGINCPFRTGASP
jgi:hypothetical protein